jgi:hypothetical protein
MASRIKAVGVKSDSRIMLDIIAIILEMNKQSNELALRPRTDFADMGQAHCCVNYMP